MNYPGSITKLYIASLFAGVCMRYGLPPEVDVFGALWNLFYSIFVLRTHVEFLEGFRLDNFLVPLMVLPIVLGPFIYSLIIGKKGVYTFIAGFFGGYYIWYFQQTLAFEVLVLAIIVIVIGIVITIYARTRG